MSRRPTTLLLLLLVAIGLQNNCCVSARPTLSRERVVLQTQYGDLHLAFYPEVAPVTTDHIIKVAELGLYNTNHIFRVDKGFVAQIADVMGGRTAPMNEDQKRVGEASVPLEVDKEVKHDKRGMLSMARWDDPHSATSSFSITLGPAAHLDMNYAIFGELISGFEVLDKLEALPTKTEGIFVMPLERITILSSYVYIVPDASANGEPSFCTDMLEKAKSRSESLASELHDQRVRMLPV